MVVLAQDKEVVAHSKAAAGDNHMAEGEVGLATAHVVVEGTHREEPLVVDSTTSI